APGGQHRQGDREGLEERAEVPPIPEDDPPQAPGLDSEDGRAGDPPRVPGDRREPSGPEPAEFEAEPEPVAERLAPAEPPDVADDRAIGRPDVPSFPEDRGQEGGLVDLGAREPEGGLAVDGEVVAGQPGGGPGPDRREERG